MTSKKELIAMKVQNPESDQPVRAESALKNRLELLGWKGLDTDDRFAKVEALSSEELVRQVTLVHEVVAPDTQNTPADFPVKLLNPTSGEKKKTFVGPDDRFAVMDKSIDIVHKLVGLDDGKEDTRGEILRRTANVLALTLAEVHPFEDGNGRTLRTLSHVIQFGMDGEQNIGDLGTLSSNRPDEGFRINSYLPKGELEFEAVLSAAASLDVPIADTEAYSNIADASFATPYEQEIIRR